MHEVSSSPSPPPSSSSSSSFSTYHSLERSFNDGIPAPGCQTESEIIEGDE